MKLECLVCQQRFDVAPLFFGCPQCRGEGRKAALVVRYDAPPRHWPDPHGDGLWRWADLLPARDGVSLGEGGTPLRPVKGWTGAGSLLLKNESCNPTWSYKDRAASVSITMARQFGMKETVAISTGNLGNSVAAYSAAAGLGCTIFCNPDAPELQPALMQRYGARVFRGGNANALVRQMVERGGVFPASIVCPLGGFANPYGIEGFKTIAFEIFEQLGRRVPEAVLVPAGSGDGLYGIWKGFSELHWFGLSDRVPRIIGCQANGADCYADAMASGAPHPTHVPHPRTVALSIAEEIGGYPALDAMRQSGGDSIAVPDDAILDAMRQLTGQGIAIEPASSTPLAVARAIAARQRAGETWVLIGTGTLVKWPPLVTAGTSMPRLLPPDFTDLGALL